MNIKKKMINENSLSKSDIFFTYDNYLDKKSNEVLNNDYFHSNITLSRNHLSGSDLLKNMINDCNYFKLKYIFIIKNILIFYIKNLYYFFFWFFYYLYSNIFSLFNFFSHKKFLANKIILIQTYVDRYSIISNGKINDNYFKELYQYLDSNKKKYFILQNISEKITNLKDRVNIIRLSLSSSNHYINEFNFLNIFDLFRILAFIFFYPINLILYLGNIKEENKVDNFYKYDLIKTLPKTSFLPYVQLLFGKKIRELSGKKLIILF